MAKNNTEKRYIVTFMDAETNQNTAAEILNVSANKMQDGVELMATDAEIKPSDILHFNGLGSTTITLSEAEVAKFQADGRVMAVEEDIEMHILMDTAGDWQGESNFDYQEASANEAMAEVAGQYFQQGYQQGQSDLYQNLMGYSAYQNNNDVFRPTPHPFPRPPFIPTPLPRLPIEPIPFPRPPYTPFPKFYQPVPWNIAMVNAPGAWARGYRGTGVKVAVLDTGITAHSDLVISGGASFIPSVASYNDGHGHGTHCAGVIGARNNRIGIVGVAPACNVYAVKVLSDSGSGSTSWILAGMAWAKDNGMHIVSMSLGSNSCQSAAYTNAIAQLNAAGVTVVCASGNSGRPTSSYRCVGSPANSPGALAVAAIDSNKVVADFSSFGTTCCPAGANPVNISAPGVSVNSTHLSGGYKQMSGTSMACPHVAGAAALVKQRFPAFTPAQIRAKLMATSTDLGAPGNDPFYGAGLVDCNKATL